MGANRLDGSPPLAGGLFTWTCPGVGIPSATSPGPNVDDVGGAVVVGAVTGTVVGGAVVRGGVARAPARDADRVAGAGPTTVAEPGAADPEPPPPGGNAGAGEGPAPAAAAASIRPLPHPLQATAVPSARCTASLRLYPLARKSASSPDTKAVAIDVPAIVAYAFPG